MKVTVEFNGVNDNVIAVITVVGVLAICTIIFMSVYWLAIHLRIV